MKNHKFLLFTDLHFHDYKNNYGSDINRLQVAEDFVRWCYKTANDLEATDIIFLGDFFHQTVMHSNTFKKALAMFNSLLIEYPNIYLYYIDGNHEQYSNDRSSSSLQDLAGLVTDTNRMYKLNKYSLYKRFQDKGIDVAFFGIDYVQGKKNFDDELTRVYNHVLEAKKGKSKQAVNFHKNVFKVLCLHQLPLQSQSTFIPFDVSPTDKRLEVFDLVFNGHDHKAKTYNEERFINMGSALQLGLSDVGEEKFIYLLEVSNNKEYELSQIPTNDLFPTFKTVKNLKDYKKEDRTKYYLNYIPERKEKLYKVDLPFETKDFNLSDFKGFLKAFIENEDNIPENQKKAYLDAALACQTQNNIFTSNIKDNCQFLDLEIEGFGSWQQRTKIELKRGINLILGLNGEGKSSIFYALCWCLFGKHPNGVNQSDIPTWSKQRLKTYKGCYASTVVNTGDKNIMIERCIKYNYEGNILNGVYIDGVKVTNEDVVELIGISFDTFVRTVVFNQNISYIVGAKSSEQLRLFEEMFGLDSINDFQGKAKDSVESIDYRISLIEKEKLNIATIEKEKINTLIEHLEKEEKRELERYTIKRKEALDRLKITEDKIEKANDSKANKRLIQIKSKMEGFKNQKESLSKFIETEEKHYKELQIQSVENSRSLMNAKTGKDRIEDLYKLAVSLNERYDTVKDLPQEIEDLQEVINTDVDSRGIEAVKDLIETETEKIKEFTAELEEDIIENSERLVRVEMMQESLHKGSCQLCQREIKKEDEATKYVFDMGIINNSKESLDYGSSEDDIKDSQDKIKELQEILDLKKDIEKFQKLIAGYQKQINDFDKQKQIVVEGLSLDLEMWEYIFTEVSHQYDRDSNKDNEKLIENLQEEEKEIVEYIKVSKKKIDKAETKLKKIISNINKGNEWLKENDFDDTNLHNDFDRQCKEVELIQKDLATRTGNLYKQIEDKKTELVKQEKLADKYTKEIQQINRQKEVYNYWVKEGFTQKGIKAYIMGIMITALNDYLATYSRYMGVSAVFKIDWNKKLKPFKIEVSLDGKTSVNYATLSDGQKKRVNIVVSIGLVQMLSTNLNIDLLTLDEPLLNLDSKGVEQFFELIRTLENKSIYIMSHRTDLDMTDVNVMKVVYDKNVRTSKINLN